MIFTIFVGLLTVAMVIACLFLILLVLVQLPKKDAGAGMAFGAGTADALFGAGSGNLLTKITSWTAGILLLLAVVLGKMQSPTAATAGADFTKIVEQKQQQAAGAAMTAQPKPQSAPSAPSANGMLSLPAKAPASNAPAK